MIRADQTDERTVDLYAWCSDEQVLHLKTYLELEERNTCCHSHVARSRGRSHQITVSLEASRRQMVLFARSERRGLLSAGHRGIARFNLSAGEPSFLCDSAVRSRTSFRGNNE